MDELTIGDKIYISSKRAAEITGYAKDYVGQLCREGRVEATLVGRAWYVLESSIRAHRFGDTGATEVLASEAASDSLPNTWSAPVYQAEVSNPMPPLTARKSINLLDTSEPRPVEPARSEPETIEDMQTAWKEWFTSREQPLLETPEIIDAREDQSTEERAFQEPIEGPAAVVQVDPVPFTPVIEDIVPIRRTYRELPAEAPPAPVPNTSRRRPNRRRRATGYGAVRAGMLAVAIISAMVAIAGSGAADAFLEKSGLGYSALRFLGGTSLLDK